MTAVAVMLAGALGAVARFVVDGVVKHHRPATFPWATFLINVTGSLLMGFLVGMVTYHSAPADLKTVLGTGFCGGYTTFSTASFEAVRLAEGRNGVISLTYAVATLLVSVLGAATGLAVAWSM